MRTTTRAVGPQPNPTPAAARRWLRARPLGLVLVLVGATVLPGCRSTGSGAATGAVVGGLLGAGGGYAVGHHRRGNKTNYTLAGGIAGAMAGYIIGDAADDRDRGRAHEDVYESAPRVRVRRVIYRRACEGHSDPCHPGW